MAGFPGAGRPTDIKNPVENIANAVTPQIAPMDIPAPTSEAPMAGVPGSSVPLQSSAEINPFEDASDPFIDSVNPFEDSSAPEVTESTVPDLTTRLKSSFAGDDDQKVQALEQQYGKDSVRKVGNDMQVKVEGKWKKVGTDGSFIGMLADNAHSYLDAAGMMVGGAIGGAAGVIESVPTFGAAVPLIPGQAILGAGAGTAVAEGISQTIRAGLFNDNRSAGAQLLGNASDLASGFNKGAAMELGGLGVAKAAGWTAKGTANVVKRVANWAANHEATQALTSKLANGVETLKGSYDQILKMQDELKESGWLDFLPGSDTFVTKAQLTGKGLDALPDAVADGINAAQSNIMEKGVTRFLDSVSNFSKSVAGNVKDVGSRFASKIADIRKTEGAFIGNFEKDAIEASGDGQLPVANTATAVQELGEMLGIVKDAKGDLTGPHPEIKETVDQVVSMLDTKAPQARDIIRKVRELTINLFNNENRMTMKDLHASYKQVSRLTNSFTDETAASGYGRQMIKLKNGLRDDILKLTDAIMDGNQPYKQARAAYSEVLDGMDLFHTMLKRDGMTSRAFANSVIKAGADGLDKLRMVKGLLQNRDPELYKDMVGQWFQDNITNNAGAFDYSKFQGVVKKLGSETVEELFGAQGAKDLDSILKIANTTIKKPFTSGSSGEIKFIQKLWKMKSVASGKILSLLHNEGSPILENVNREGIEKYVSGLGSNAEKHEFRQWLGQAVQEGRNLVSGAAKVIDPATEQLGKLDGVLPRMK